MVGDRLTVGDVRRREAEVRDKQGVDEPIFREVAPASVEPPTVFGSLSWRGFAASVAASEPLLSVSVTYTEPSIPIAELEVEIVRFEDHTLEDFADGVIREKN